MKEIVARREDILDAQQHCVRDLLHCRDANTIEVENFEVVSVERTIGVGFVVAATKWN